MLDRLQQQLLFRNNNFNNSGGAAAAGRRRRPVVVAGPGQGKAGKTGPGQTKPRQGTTGKPAKPKQDFRVPWGAQSGSQTLCCNKNQPPSAASGGCAAAVVVAGPGQVKASETGPGQTKPVQGTTSKPAKPRQAALSTVFLMYQK